MAALALAVSSPGASRTLILARAKEPVCSRPRQWAVRQCRGRPRPGGPKAGGPACRYP